MDNNAHYSLGHRAFMMVTTTTFEVIQLLKLATTVSGDYYSEKAIWDMPWSSCPVYGVISNEPYTFTFSASNPSTTGISTSSFRTYYSSLSNSTALSFTVTYSNHYLYSAFLYYSSGYRYIQYQWRAGVSSTNYRAILGTTGYDTYVSRRIHSHDNYAWIAYVQQSQIDCKCNCTLLRYI